MKKLILVCVLLGCTPEIPKPVIVTTGTGDEATGKYEFYKISVGNDAQTSLADWYKEHRDLTIVCVTGIVVGESGTCWLLITAYKESK